MCSARKRARFRLYRTARKRANSGVSNCALTIRSSSARNSSERDIVPPCLSSFTLISLEYVVVNLHVPAVFALRPDHVQGLAVQKLIDLLGRAFDSAAQRYFPGSRKPL